MSVVPIKVAIQMSECGPGSNLTDVQTTTIATSYEVPGYLAAPVPPTATPDFVSATTPEEQMQAINSYVAQTVEPPPVTVTTTTTTERTVLIGREPPATVGAVVTTEDGSFGVLRASIHACTWGTTGGTEIVCPISAQPFGKFQGKDYVGLFQAARRTRGYIDCSIQVTADNSLVLQADPDPGQPYPIFSGFLDEANYSLDRDEVALHFRDRACLIMEGAIAARSVIDQTLTEVVQTFASEIGDTTYPLISTAPIMSQKLGQLIHVHRIYMEHRISAWNFLQKLAKMVGFVCFVDPSGSLYFGPLLRTDLTPITLLWGGPGEDGDLESLSVQHTPFRNGAFFLQVGSQDPINGQIVNGTAAYINPEALAYKSLSPPLNEFTVGATLPFVTSITGPIQTYNFYGESLTPESAQTEAVAKALDIIRHEIIVRGRMPGNGLLQVGRQINFSNTGIDEVDSNTFVLASVEHSLEIGQGTATASGFTTEFVAWQSCTAAEDQA